MIGKHKYYENTGLKSYTMNSAVFNKIRTHSNANIGARSVITTRLSFVIGVDALKIIMNFIIIIKQKKAWYCHMKCVQ
jgi:hypothetical protein